MNEKSRLDVLIADDEEGMRALMETILEGFGLTVRAVASGAEAVAVIEDERPRVFIQDLRMGGLDGMELLERAKAIDPELPVIVITAYSTWGTAVEAMRLGADDYMGKPFNPRELLARIKAALRRVQVGAEKTSRLTVSHSDRRGFWDGQLIDLTGAEFELLALFYANCGEVISRDRISFALKGHSASPFDRSVDTLVSRLRRKLKHASSIDLIRSVRGKGYLFSL